MENPVSISGPDVAELLLKYVLFVLIVAPQELVKMQHTPKPLAQLPDDVPPGIIKQKQL